MVRQRKERAEKITGILVGANYYRDCRGYPADELILKYIDQALADSEHYETVLQDLPFR